MNSIKLAILPIVLLFTLGIYIFDSVDSVNSVDSVDSVDSVNSVDSVDSVDKEEQKIDQKIAEGASENNTAIVNNSSANSPTLVPTQAPAIKAKHKNKPEFAKIRDVKEKKQTFFEYMLPMIRQTNAAVLTQRESILSIQQKFIDNKKYLLPIKYIYCQ